MHRIMTLGVSVMLLAIMVSCSQDVAEPLDPEQPSIHDPQVEFTDPALEILSEIYGEDGLTEQEWAELREVSNPVLTITIEDEIYIYDFGRSERHAQGLDEFPLDCYSILPPELWGTTMPTFDLYIFFAGQMTDDAIGWGHMYSCPAYLAIYDVIYTIDDGTGMFVAYLTFISEQGGYPPGSYPWCCDVPNDLDRDCPGLREVTKTCE